MRKSKWIKVLTSIGVVFLIVFVVIPPFTRKWYRNRLLNYAPPIPIDSWKKFSSSEGKFSIWFPGTPVETNQIAVNVFGSAEEHIFYVNTDIQDGYFIGYCDSEKFGEAIKSGSDQNFLESAESVVITEANGKVSFEQETTFENCPAREFEYKAGGKANYSVRVKYVMAGRRVYSISAIFLNGNPYLENRTTFFNSFHLEN
jgi:hypothetical protein